MARRAPAPSPATPFFEICVQGQPVSAQTANRQALRTWKATVADAARTAWTWNAPLTGDVAFEIAYYAEGKTGDLDNLVKPIQNALQGIAYANDTQVRKLSGARFDIDANYKVRFMPLILGAAFAGGRPFIHIRVWRSPVTGELS